MDRIVRFVLKHAPNWLLDLIEWMLQRDSTVIRWIKGVAAAGVPVPTPVRPDASAPVRVFFGPFNYAGQAWEWARSLERRDRGVSARNLTVVFPNDLGFQSDDRVPATVFSGSTEWRDRQEVALETYTHIVVESFTSVLGRGRGRGLEREVQWHLSQGRAVAFVCHGTDIRSPELHRQRSVFSPFVELDEAEERLERRVAENKNLIETLGVPVYFSTPDLVHDVPNGQWLPLVVTPSRWEEAASSSGVQPGERDTPLVIHASTSSKVKGSGIVAQVAEELAGIVEYRPLTGIPSADMPSHVAEADIVIDQLLLGSYGVAACESMAAGRVVVGNVDDEVRTIVRETSGTELPIIQADPDTLQEVLQRLANDRHEMVDAAIRGPEFVRAVHSGELSAKVLAEFLGRPAASP